MAKKGNRPFLRLKCTECKSLNYTTKKSKVNTQEALELKKFCKRCRKHTLHREVKIK